ncbi:hypothetical protein CAP36_11105 [Chitinophagaceae bacterium IBVUCB2]|nr:hypothetical protein CAP36_11105 [Chitinophagaceae bacterium IBVUCB2]
MKKILLSMMAVMGITFITTVANAADRYAVANGNWNSTTTWSATSGGAPGASIPVAGDNVIIERNFNVTIPSAVNAVCTNLTIGFTTGFTGTLTFGATGSLAASGNVTVGFDNSTSREGTINMSAGGTMTIGGNLTIGNAGTTAPIASEVIQGTGSSITVTGNVSILNPNNGGFANQWSVGAGSATVTGTLTLANTGANDEDCNFSISTGTATLTGAVTMNGAAGENSIAITSTGTLNLGNSISLTNGTFSLATGSTVNYNGAAQTIRTATYSNLSVSGSGIKTTSADIAMTGNLLVASGATLTLGGNDIDIDVNAARSVTINGVLNINGNGRLVESQGNTKTLIINSGGLLNITDNGGTGLPILDVYSFDANSTVNFGSTDNQTIENTVTYGNLTTSGTGTKTLETSGGTMTFLGSITIGAGTTLDANDKTMNVGGNWLNNGAFTQTNTTVIFNGAAAETISGSTATTFNNITFNNTLPGTGVAITLNTAATVTGVATFTDGVVSTNSALLTFNDQATTTGASNASYVDGPVRKNGNNDFTFPVGDPLGSYHPFRLVNTGGADGDAYTATYFRASARALGSLSSGLYGVSNCEYWTLARNAGTSTPNIHVSWTAESPCAGVPYTTTGTGLVVARLNGGTWELADGTNQAATGTYGVGGAGTVADNTITAIGTFALGNTQPEQNPLPVTFSDVKAFEKGNGVQIEWSNLTEKDVVNYIVERSANGNDFVAIGQLTARSNQTDKQSYLSFDGSPLSGANFYRIKVVELDGKIIYSKMLRVEIGKTVKGISLYPNPVTSGEVTIGFTAAKGLYTLRIMNAAGQQVSAKQIVHPGGNVSQAVTIPASVKSGFYVMTISGENFKESKTFVIQ